MYRTFRDLALPVVALVLLVSSCGGASASSPPQHGQEGAFPTTVHDASGDVRIASRPQRIVSLSPTATEDLFAVGAGHQVVAVDDQSDFPAEAPRSPLSGFTPNAEAVLAQHPDLVVIGYDANGIVAALRAAGVAVLVEPTATSIDDAYDQLTDLGAATGHSKEAGGAVDGMRSAIHRIVQETPKPSTPLRYYHEVDDTYYSITSASFLGQVYASFGLQDVADAAGATTSFPQLSAEYVVKSDPDLIFLADGRCCKQSASTVAQRPGWGQLHAVRDGDVIVIDDAIASRWSPRLVELVRTIGDAVQRAEGRR